MFRDGNWILEIFFFFFKTIFTEKRLLNVIFLRGFRNARKSKVNVILWQALSSFGSTIRNEAILRPNKSKIVL